MPKGGIAGRQRVKDPPWKIDSHMKRFSNAEMKRAPQAAAEQIGGVGVDVHAHGMHPEYRTTQTDAYGPSDSGVILKERLKQLSALDECVTKNWTTTQDAIGARATAQVEGKAEAKQALAHKRSKCSFQTHQPWTTTSDGIGSTATANIQKKGIEKHVKIYFPKEVDYNTTQEEYGEHFPEFKKAPKKTLRPSDPEPIDAFTKTSSAYGTTYPGFAVDRQAKAKVLQQTYARQQRSTEEDVLGPVNPTREEEAFLKAYKDDQAKTVRSKLCSNFMISDVDKPAPVIKEGPPLHDLGFNKATSYKIRKGLQALNIDPDSL